MRHDSLFPLLWKERKRNMNRLYRKTSKQPANDIRGRTGYSLKQLRSDNPVRWPIEGIHSLTLITSWISITNGNQECNQVIFISWESWMCYVIKNTGKKHNTDEIFKLYDRWKRSIILFLYSVLIFHCNFGKISTLFYFCQCILSKYHAKGMSPFKELLKLKIKKE